MPDLPFDEDEAREELTRCQAEGAEYAVDARKGEDLLNRGLQKIASLRKPLAEIWDDLMLLISLARDYISGRYRDVSIGAIAAIMGLMLYLLSPIDLIPDFIPVIGYLDDIFVIGLVISQLHPELQKYRTWRDVQVKTAPVTEDESRACQEMD